MIPPVANWFHSLASPTPSTELQPGQCHGRTRNEGSAPTPPPWEGQDQALQGYCQQHRVGVVRSGFEATLQLSKPWLCPQAQVV